MRKYALLFCFIIILLFSNEIEVEQFNQYYDYAVLILRGLSGKNDTTKQECANLLNLNKTTYSPLFLEMFEKFQNNSLDMNEFITYYYEPLIPVDKVCHLLYFLAVYLNFKNDIDYVNKTLTELGQSLNNIIDFSVD